MSIIVADQREPLHPHQDAVGIAHNIDILDVLIVVLCDQQQLEEEFAHMHVKSNTLPPRD